MRYVSGKQRFRDTPSTMYIAGSALDRQGHSWCPFPGTLSNKDPDTSYVYTDNIEHVLLLLCVVGLTHHPANSIEWIMHRWRLDWRLHAAGGEEEERRFWLDWPSEILFRDERQRRLSWQKASSCWTLSPCLTLTQQCPLSHICFSFNRRLARFVHFKLFLKYVGITLLWLK